MQLPRFPTRLLPFLALATLSTAQTPTYVWTGANATVGHGYATGNATDPANWQGNVAPPFGSPDLSGRRLVFGTAPHASTFYVYVDLPSVNALGLQFLPSAPNYGLLHFDHPLGLGASGIVASNPISSVDLFGPIILTANQTWEIDGMLYAHGQIQEEEPGTTLTKTGTGGLVLNSSQNNFSGGLTVLDGALYLGSSSSAEGSAVNGPIGAGTLTLGDDTALRTNTFADVHLHNAIRLGDGVTFGDFSERNSLHLHGAITPNQTNTTLRLAADGAVFFAGNVTNAAGGATSLTFVPGGFSTASGGSGYSIYDTFPIAVLSGNNTYSGGTTAQNAGVVFLTASALPATGNLLALDGGYLSAGFSGGLANIIARITNPAAFSGSLGLDTDPRAESGPTPFDDAINLSAFTPDTGPITDGFWGLGSLSRARLTANSTLTPPDGGNYLFGGGDGTLYVATNLGAPANSPAAGVRVRSPFNDRPLTVYLQGNNTFAGSILVDHSIVVLDSATALPADVSIGLDDHAYIGFTENSPLTPAQLIARLNPSGYSATSILGFDHAPDNQSHGVTINDPVNLTGLSDIYLGSSTHAHLAGQIRAPSSGTLSLTGINGGWLTIDSALAPNYTAGNATVSGVNSLRIGINTSQDALQDSFVELAHSGSTYSGGTLLQNGYLLVGGSSATANGTITSGPLGTGPLTFLGYNYARPATLVVTHSAGVTLHNPIGFISGAVARFGAPAPEPGDDDDPAATVRDFAANSLTLAGNLSGFSGGLNFVGDAVFTLSGNNSALHAGAITIGDSGHFTATRLVATTPRALGDENTLIWLKPTANLQFTSPSTTPVTFSIGAIEGGTPQNFDLFGSHLALDDGDTLNINQNSHGTLYANIGGVPTDWTDHTATPTSAAVIKNGSGTLTLAGDNAFSGGLTINAGGIVAASNTALGSGNVTLNGGKLALGDQVTLTNNLLFGAAGGTLGGNATFTTPVTVGTNVTLAPGNSPGTLTFTNGLTFSSGGSLSIDIVDLSLSAGIGYDTVNVSGGAFAIAATAAQPFTIQINSLSALSNSLGALTTDSSVARSLTLLQAPTAITGLIGDGTPGLSNLVLQTQNFTNFQPGLFSLALGGVNNSALVLNFTPVPEPSTYALLGLGLALVGWQLHRRRRAR